MKGLVFTLLAVIIISGGITVTYQNTEGAQSVSVRIDNPEDTVKTAEMFWEQIAESLEASKDETDHKPAVPNESECMIYRIRKPDNNPASQIGAYFNLEAAKSNCKSGYCVFDQYGTLIFADDPALI